MSQRLTILCSSYVVMNIGYPSSGALIQKSVTIAPWEAKVAPGASRVPTYSRDEPPHWLYWNDYPFQFYPHKPIIIINI